ncbi:MAG TPA: nucleotidyltransferase family protein [Lichenihabitans sp.]|jgi:molybdenum cofactor cytidylyltransferase|nr:nucleotidyltransferase family protein [Lichenihabitans sp.]
MATPDAGRIAALVLAAGTASRYRAADPAIATKLIAELDGVPLVRHVAMAALASRARPVQVVTGHAAEAVAVALDGLDVRLVPNPDFARGLATSLKAGVAALPGTTRGVLVLLADMPCVGPALLDRLIAAFGRDPETDAVVPVHGGRRGNPVLLGRSLFEAVGHLEGDEGARRLLADARVREIEIADPSVVIDVDEPAALRTMGRIRKGDVA